MAEGELAQLEHNAALHAAQQRIREAFRNLVDLNGADHPLKSYFVAEKALGEEVRDELRRRRGERGYEFQTG